jgi:hypothetical protein
LGGIICRCFLGGLITDKFVYFGPGLGTIDFGVNLIGLTHKGIGLGANSRSLGYWLLEGSQRPNHGTTEKVPDDSLYVGRISILRIV